MPDAGAVWCLMHTWNLLLWKLACWFFSTIKPRRGLFCGLCRSSSLSSTQMMRLCTELHSETGGGAKSMGPVMGFFF